jgi:hypothetical protein
MALKKRLQDKELILDSDTHMSDQIPFPYRESDTEEDDRRDTGCRDD